MRRLASAVVWIGLFAVHPLSTQQSQPNARRAGRVPVTVAIVERLPQAGAPYVIMRRAGGTARDVILLPGDASAQHLTEAVQALVTARQVGGDTAAAAATLRVRRSNVQRAFPWALRVMDDLRTSGPREVPGIGRVPAVEIWLPSQSRRNARLRAFIEPGARPKRVRD